MAMYSNHNVNFKRRSRWLDTETVGSKENHASETVKKESKGRLSPGEASDSKQKPLSSYSLGGRGFLIILLWFVHQQLQY